MTPLPLIFGSVILVSAISIVGILLFLIQKQRFQDSLLPIVSFSTGALLGNVFLHLLPEITQAGGLSSPFIILLGLLLSFLLEKIICWHHCHMGHCEHGCRPAGPLNLLGDAVHNLLDGIAIAASFLVSVPLGFSTTLAVMLHEIPQEVGDFAILLHSGFSPKKALLLNLLSALAALVGALFGIAFTATTPILGTVLLPLVAGNFLYVALADLIPELHREVQPRRAALQLLWMILGIGLMTLL